MIAYQIQHKKKVKDHLMNKDNNNNKMIKRHLEKKLSVIIEAKIETITIEVEVVTEEINDITIQGVDIEIIDIITIEIEITTIEIDTIINIIYNFMKCVF